MRLLVDKYDRAATIIVGNGAHANNKNVREAFKGTSAMFLGSWEDAIYYTCLYFTGILPFTRIENIDVMSSPWMTRDFTARKIVQRR